MNPSRPIPSRLTPVLAARPTPSTDPASGPSPWRPPSRRQFLGRCAGVAGIAAVLPPALSPTGNVVLAADPAPSGIPMRRNILALSDSDLTKLGNAFATLAKRSRTDPTSMMFQANVHDVFCNAPKNDKPPQTTNGDQNVHASWKFLPWHRGYLYYLEKMLQDAAGDPTVMLPYWDWTKDYNIPAQYWGSGLRDPRRQAKSGERLSDSIIALCNLGHLLSLDFEDFGGEGGDDAAAGELETGPHNHIHDWVGGDMSELATAGRDPIFFSGHHSNVDRVWSLWMQKHPQGNPTDPAWTGMSFTYWDTKGQQFSATVADILKLSYGYEEMAAPTAIASAGKALRSEPLTLDAGKLPDAVHASLVGQAGAQTGAKIRLRIRGVRLTGGVPVAVRVFVNLPQANASTPLSAPQRVGGFHLLPHAGGADRPMNINLDITDALRGLLRQQPANELKVTLVPEAPPRGGRVQGGFTFESIRIESH